MQVVHSSLPKSGGPRSTTPQLDQFIKLNYLRNRKAIAGNIQSLINATRGKTISKTTARIACEQALKLN
jgi:ribosomal protein S30